jgi:hypothetical protein
MSDIGESLYNSADIEYCYRCSLGASKNDISLYKFPSNFKIVKCQQSGISYLNPRLSETAIATYYSKEGYWSIAYFYTKTNYIYDEQEDLKE